MSHTGVKALIRMYGLTAKAGAIQARIEAMKVSNREYDPGSGPYGADCFTDCEKEFTEISDELTRMTLAFDKEKGEEKPLNG